MRIGLQVPSFTWQDGPKAIGPKLAEIGRTADEAGFASLWVMDHFFQIEYVGPPEDPMLEGYSALSYLAGRTERVKLGTLVTGIIGGPADLGQLGTYPVRSVWPGKARNL